MNLSKYNDKMIMMDVDGVLCKGECWNKEDCLVAEPIIENIDKNNSLYLAGAHIIIHTSRPEKFRNATEYWLRENGVQYHAMVMGNRKCGSDWYCDDKNLDINKL
jgi:uncharacterized HAD superfamily protein